MFTRVHATHVSRVSRSRVITVKVSIGGLADEDIVLPGGNQIVTRGRIREISLLVGERPAFSSTWTAPCTRETERRIARLDLAARAKELEELRAVG